MLTILVRRTKGGLPANKIRAAGEAISRGRIVVFPTETVYGIGGDALDGDAVRSIFRIKGRPPDNPVIVHVARISDVQPLVSELPETARILMEAFWPGPLTLVMKKSEAVPKAVTGGLGNVSVRMPANRVALSLIKAAGTPVAAPSANLSGRPSITTFSEAVAELDGRVDFIIDGGKCRIGVESTVVDMTRKIPLLLRPGGLPVEEIERVIGSIDIHPAASGRGKFRGRAPSPGMKYRHYSPVHDGKPDAFLIYTLRKYEINTAPVQLPLVLSGLFIGATLPFFFTSFLMGAVGRAAQSIVIEVRRQFREHPGILAGQEKPDYGKCVDVVTKEALRQLVVPALVAVLSPILVGILLGPTALAGLLIGVVISGFALAILMTVGGAAWDNGKKVIEAGEYGGKGSEAHKAAIVGDTVGDATKDTAGPAINPLIKVVNTVSILSSCLIAENRLFAILSGSLLLPSLTIAPFLNLASLVTSMATVKPEDSSLSLASAIEGPEVCSFSKRTTLE